MAGHDYGCAVDANQARRLNADAWPGQPLDEFDTPAEVDAIFRTQRRIAVGYFCVFLVVTLGVPALTLVLDWWSSGRIVGGMSPNFAMAAIGLYVFFLCLAVAAGSLATAVEDRMLGGPVPYREKGPQS